MDWREGLIILLIMFLCITYDFILPDMKTQASPSQDGEEEGEPK
jgi:hypothetical protein